MNSNRRATMDFIFVVAVVFIASLFGILTRPIGFLATLWPANAILLGLMVRYPRFDRIACWGAAAIGYITADLISGGSLPITLWLSAGNLVFAYSGTKFFGWLDADHRRLINPPSVLFLFAICLGAAILAAGAGSGAGKALFQKPILDNFKFWVSTELVNAIVVLPVILTAPSGLAGWKQILRGDGTPISAWRDLLPLLSVVVSVATGLVVGGPGSIAFPIPSLLWCALSYRLFPSTLITMLVCLWMMIAIASGILQIPLTEDFMNSMTSVRLGITLLALAPLTVASVNTTRNRLLERERKAGEALKMARDEARAAEEAKGHFLAMMSHEIRTPLNGIVGMIDLLEESLRDRDQLEMTRVIQASSHSLLTIINSVLDFSKIEAGMLPITISRFELMCLLENSVALFAPAAEQKGLTLTLKTGDELEGHFMGDEGRIRQILSNLLSNAIKFTRRGSVTVEASRVSHDSLGKTEVRIEVRDTGIGIAEPAQERLFHPFVQAEEAVANHYEGSGLGLSISKQLLKLMDGSIGFTSKADQGSVFWITLPLEASDTGDSAPATEPVAETRTELRTEAKRILVVDDNEVNRLVSCRLLSSLGCEARSASDGEEALSLLSHSPYDLVLLDCRMPSPDGFEVAARIRSGEVGGLDPRIPIIALTASSSPGDRSKCFAAGMDDFMSKPVTLQSMRSMLARDRTDRHHVPAAVEEAIDFSVLNALDSLPGRREGVSLRHEVVALFLTHFPGELRRLDQAIQARDAALLSSVCHCMAGSCATVGARRMKNLLRGIEDSALSDSWRTVECSRQELDFSWSKAKDLLNHTPTTPPYEDTCSR